MYRVQINAGFFLHFPDDSLFFRLVQQNLQFRLATFNKTCNYRIAIIRPGFLSAKQTPIIFCNRYDNCWIGSRKVSFVAWRRSSTFRIPPSIDCVFVPQASCTSLTTACSTLSPGSCNYRIAIIRPGFLSAKQTPIIFCNRYDNCIGSRKVSFVAFRVHAPPRMPAFNRLRFRPTGATELMCTVPVEHCFRVRKHRGILRG